MKIELLKAPTATDWMLCKRCALVTAGKTPVTPPNSSWKQKLLEARHSPIRELKFVFYLEIPYCNAMHLVRHVHAQPYVQSQRNDRQSEYNRNAARQDAPVNMILSVNAEELMVIANKRLCGQADAVTRRIVANMCSLAIGEVPEMQYFLVPMCKYHGGVCHEINCCGRNRNEVTT